MKLELSRAHFPVKNLGYGTRAGIWVQGCSIRCFGCISRDTWAPNPSSGADVTEILRWLAELPSNQIDGLTISGGEPFDQPEPLMELLLGVSAWRADISRPIDVVSYSGRSLTELREQHERILSLLDVVIPEPFVAAQADEAPLRGSANQTVVPLTELGRDRYAEHRLQHDFGQQRRQMQVEVDGDDLWFIGIPSPGAMKSLEKKIASRGIKIGRTSWLT
ncbi:radical SAM protein [Arthrobacter bambusae]|uniref:4Fe-4S single cluster domain-containing protein n=1 Tax=Arthrobacter bambusae TaxID=1338426 RepID=UPI001F50D998|nr:4Fe-4S single cluster domain-containing protein [Arthrobacter bambusae]MCI0144047.1 radical SAM protein [Arthrobacter bambusae]